MLKAALVTLTLSIATISSVLSQGEYVVLTEGDTLFGDIRGLDEIASCHKIIIDLADGSTLRLKPREVREYYRTDYGSERFITHEVWKKASMWPNLAFLQVYLDGEVQLLLYDYALSSGGQFGGSSVSVQDQYLYYENKLTLIREKKFLETIKPIAKSHSGIEFLLTKGYLTFHDLKTVIWLLNDRSRKGLKTIGFERGSVELESGEIVEGLIKKISAAMSCYRIVMLDHSGSARIFNLSDVSAYTRGTESFKRFEIDWGNRHVSDSLAFMKLMMDGIVKVYSHTLPLRLNKNAFEDYTSVDQKYDENNYNLYLEYEDSLTHLNPDNFRIDGARFFAEHTVLAEAIKSKQLKFRDLKGVVEEYNNFLEFIKN